jgi:hypothetical protein
MKNSYLQEFVNKTARYRTSLFCLAASCSYLLAGQPQDAHAGTVKKLSSIDPESAKRLVARINEKMSVCGNKSMIDIMKDKHQALETTIFSPKSAAVLLAGTDACPGTNIPGGTSFTDTGDNTGSNSTVTTINACSDYTDVKGADQIYRFVLPALGSRIATCSINLTTTGTDDLTIYTLSQGGGGCPAGTANSVTNCVNGSDQVFGGGTETITDAEMDAMPAGTYYLFVDSFYLGSDPDGIGPYTMNFNCTSLSPTAAYVAVGGRVTAADGRGIGNSRVSVMLPGGESRSTVTNPFGFFRIDDLEAGQSYVFQVANKSYQFSNPTQLINVDQSIEDLNFVADAPGAERK